MKLKYATPDRTEKNFLVFLPDLDTIRRSPPFPSGVHNVHVHYRARHLVEWGDGISIPEGRWGNLGPHGDMVYFGNGLYPDAPDNKYTIACPIEVVLLHPDAFEPRLGVDRQIELRW